MVITVYLSSEPRVHPWQVQLCFNLSALLSIGLEQFPLFQDRDLAKFIQFHYDSFVLALMLLLFHSCCIMKMVQITSRKNLEAYYTCSSHLVSRCQSLKTSDCCTNSKPVQNHLIIISLKTTASTTGYTLCRSCKHT